MGRLARVALSTLIALAAVGLNARPASADLQTSAQMLQTLNGHRYSVGAPTIAADPRVLSAAQHHADYSSLNGYMGHFETAGLPGYTGYSARDRVAAQGWSTSFVSEVATGGNSA